MIDGPDLEPVAYFCTQIWQPDDYYTWELDRQRKWDKIDVEPNKYYLLYPPPGMIQNEEPWSQEEKEHLVLMLKLHPHGKKWGLFSMNMPNGRTGTDVSFCGSFSLFRSLLMSLATSARNASNK